jgi:transcriptional regulator with XRE-family HTH domain
MTKLGDVIREKRIAIDLSQKDLAARIKKEDGTSITPQFLNDIEFNRRTPSEFILKRIAAALDLDADYLVILAGSLPSDILERGVTEKTAKEAVRLFRRKA